MENKNSVQYSAITMNSIASGVMTALRKSSGVTQQQVADVLKTTLPTIRRLEKGDGKVDFGYLCGYASILGMSYVDVVCKIKEAEEELRNNDVSIVVHATSLPPDVKLLSSSFLAGALFTPLGWGAAIGAALGFLASDSLKKTDIGKSIIGGITDFFDDPSNNKKD